MLATTLNKNLLTGIVPLWYNKGVNITKGFQMFNYLAEANKIAEANNIKVTYRKCRGYANTIERSIECTEPKGYKSFFTFLHECGHILEPNACYRTAKTRALAEYRATVWAKRTLKELGLPVKRDVSASYDRYIKNKIARGLRRGGKVPPELAHIAKGITKGSYF